MQLSPLSSDLFSASAPPASGGASLDPAAAPFAQWLLAQTRSAPTLADPSAPAPFSQFPLNWGFPTVSPAPTELPVAGADSDQLLTAMALPKPATAPLPALAEELPVTESLSVPAEANAALPGKPRRAIPSVDAAPPELTTAASSEPQLDPLASVSPAFAAPTPQLGFSTPGQGEPERAAQMPRANLAPAVQDVVPPPVVTPTVQHAQPAVVPSPSITPDPLPAVGVTQPAVDPSPPVLAARPSQSATPSPQGLPRHGAPAPLPSPEPPPVTGSQQSEIAPGLPTQPVLTRSEINPVQTAAGQSVPAMVTGAAPQVLAPGAGLLAGLVPPTAVGNVPVGPRQSTVSRPSPLWATATALEAGAAEGLPPAPVSELLTASRPVDAVAAGQQPRNSSLSDQRFADLFAAPSAPAQAVPPQLTPVAATAGFEAAIQLTSETLQPPSQLEGAPTAVVTPLGLPAAPLGSTSSAAPVLTLPSGLQVPEQEVLQQIFGQLPARALSGPQRLTLRLNPEELGEVRLELIVDKETVRAHLLAQSQQVQEVLEKHLPRLREAFEQQGLKLQELQVSVDSGRDGGRSFFGQSQHQQPAPNFAGSGNNRRNPDGAVTDPVIPPPVAPRSSGGLSLRV